MTVGMGRQLLVFMLIIVAVLLVGLFTLPSERNLKDSKELLYKGEWRKINSDGSYTVIYPSVKLEADENDTVVVQTLLPDTVENGDSLCFPSVHESVHVAVADAEAFGKPVVGKEILNYDTTGHFFSGNNSASRYLMIPITEDMRGKTLVFTVTGHSAYAGWISASYYGQEAMIWGTLIWEGLPATTLALITLVFGILLLLESYSLVYTVLKQAVELLYLGWTAVFLGTWVIFESNFRQLYFPNASLIAIVAFFVLPLIPYTVTCYFDVIQKKRYTKYHRLSQCVILTDLAAIFLLHASRLADVLQTMIFTYLACGITIAITIVTVVVDILHKETKEYPNVVVGVFVVSGFALVEIVCGILQITSVFTGVFLGLGFIVFFLLALRDALYNLIRAEQKRQRAVVEGEAKGQFLANMSHEIRTPINAILGMNEMILRSAKTKEVIDYATNIESSGNFLLSVINDILDYTKIQSGNLQLITDDYAISSLMNDLRMTFQSRAEKKGLDFAIRVEQNTPEHLIGDEFRIRQVMLNLINNAIKYTDQGSVMVFVSGKEINEGEVLLTVSVADTGRGIKKEDRDKLFLDFTRVDEENNRNVEGTGLGLSITKSLLDLMGGSLSLESKYGRGSTFTVTIPQKCENYIPVGDFSQRISNTSSEREAYKESFHAIRARILVVDDNAMNLEVVRLLLEPTRVKIRLAESGREALKILEEETFHLIFLDQMMPDMSGVETLHEIRRRHPDMTAPVVALTANALSGARENFLREGFADYLSKPVRAQELENCLRNWLPRELMENVELAGEEAIKNTSFTAHEQAEFALGNREVVAQPHMINRWTGGIRHEEKPKPPEESENDEVFDPGESTVSEGKTRWEDTPSDTADDSEPWEPDEPKEIAHSQRVTVDGMSFPAIPGVDWKIAVENLLNEDLIKKAIAKMVEITPEMKQQLRSWRDAVLLDEKDDRAYEEYETQAHAMKANARTIGSDIMEQAYMLECAGRDRKKDVILNETEVFLEEWDSLIEYLDAYVKE
ncbi:MAG: response regulator [Lachnospiraceae bacterium]|nr:response regulator [Lachnospiraceae bacterium]